MYDTGFLEAIREYELAGVLPLLPPGSSVLDIGAGTGSQAKKMAQAGHAVCAIDVQSSLYKPDRVWEVIDYDGFHIPFPDDRFDVVFSSNSLEHIKHVEEFQAEIYRVLKKDGMAIHILPTSFWRTWSNIMHYPAAIKFLWALVSGSKSNAQNKVRANAAKNKRGLQFLLSRILPSRHGEWGNFITETYYFSRARWSRLFRRTGWRVIKYKRSRLFYSGKSILGSRLGLSARHYLSFILGSGCHVFILGPEE